jgi:Glycosyltransferase family 87
MDARGGFDPRLKAAVLLSAAVLAVARLVGLGFEYAGESVQTDFAAYYTAGQMIDAGLSPYRYLITPERIIWTSGDLYRHAQYIYPPLLAELFVPVVRSLSYLSAKYAWWFVDLIGLALILSFSRRALRVPAWPWTFVLIVGAGVFHPLTIQLLRGQIDLVTGALLGLALWLFARRRADFWAGAVLGATALVKFHAGFLFPFLLIRRKWRGFFGFCVAVAIMAALNLTVAGPENIRRYLAELPRISVYGGDGPPSSHLPPEQLALLQPLYLPGGGVVKDGFAFRHRGFRFVTNASFVEVICCGTGFHLARSVASAAVWLFFVVAFALLTHRAYAAPRDAAGEYLYWFAAANAALLAGPTTWTMNVVWLLPAFSVTAYLWLRRTSGLGLQIALAIFAAGLLLVAMPDHISFPGLFPLVLLRLSIYKYPLGEGLLILGSFVYLRHARIAAGAEGGVEIADAWASGDAH